MGGLIFYLLGNADYQAVGGILIEKAKMMSFEVNWLGFLTLLAQVVGVGGVLVFGFVASWIFGREYSDKTAKDLLALPVSRSTILNAKFIIYLIWCLALVLSNLILGLLVGSLVDLGPVEFSKGLLRNYFIISILVSLLGTPIAFFALWGRGYLAPLSIVALMLVISQVIGAMGFGHYFPWALPGLYSGAAGEYKVLINTWSYLILLLVSTGQPYPTYDWQWVVLHMEKYTYP
jgi:ABC-2 type transport system permease protein